jgi:hypothetical protein
MTFNDFEKNISSTLLKKGLAYFEEDRVDNPEKIAPGSWVAEVHGSDSYQVVISSNRSQIKGWECDCPYDHGPICKHVIAVFYAIADEMNQVAKVKPKGKSSAPKDKAGLILKKVSKSDLEKFITNQFKRNKGLKSAFISHFAELLDEEPDQKYKTIVRNAYKSVQDRYGFIDYKSSYQLSTLLSSLTKKAEELLLKHNVLESLALVKAIIEEVPLMLDNMDDSSGGIGDVFYDTTNIFSQIVEQSPPLLKDELFKYCLTEYSKPKYSDFGFEEIFLDEASLLVSNSEQEQSLFEIIDNRLNALQDDGYGRYEIVRLVGTKYSYFLNNNKDREAQELITENDHYPEFREILIAQAIKRKDWESAKTICREGIKIAESINHMGVVLNWNVTLLDIAEKEGNISEQRTLSELLFFDHRLDMSYYKKLKSTYPKNEWSGVSEKIINKLKGKDQRGGYTNVSALAQIFIEENYHERLMKLLEINSKSLQFVDAFKDQLPEQYDGKLIEIYTEGIKEYAKSTGRGIYHEVADFLKKMQKMKGGDIKVKSLIGQFREQYKMRPAMIETLNKKFPETIILKGKDIQKMINKNLGLFDR